MFQQDNALSRHRPKCYLCIKQFNVNLFSPISQLGTTLCRCIIYDLTIKWFMLLLLIRQNLKVKQSQFISVKTFNQNRVPSEIGYRESQPEQVETEGVDKGLNGVIFLS